MFRSETKLPETFVPVNVPPDPKPPVVFPPPKRLPVLLAELPPNPGFVFAAPKPVGMDAKVSPVTLLVSCGGGLGIGSRKTHAQYDLKRFGITYHLWCCWHCCSPQILQSLCSGFAGPADSAGCWRRSHQSRYFRTTWSLRSKASDSRAGFANRRWYRKEAK